jgi:hypothetical protein
MSNILNSIYFDKRISISTDRLDINIDINDINYNSIWLKYNKNEKLENIKLSLTYDNDTYIKKDKFDNTNIYLSIGKIENIYYYSKNYLLNVYKKEIKVYKDKKCVETVNRGPYCFYSTKNKDKTVLHSH